MKITTDILNDLLFECKDGEKILVSIGFSNLLGLPVEQTIEVLSYDIFIDNDRDFEVLYIEESSGATSAKHFVYKDSWNYDEGNDVIAAKLYGYGDDAKVILSGFEDGFLSSMLGKDVN